MPVKLIAKTVPVSEEFGKSLSEFIAYCARVSNPNNQWNHETAAKLLEYLEKHKHFSPFEMADICLEIETTRDIARQLLRHRSFSFQEFSQRYANVKNSSPPKEARLQDLKNRQNSIEVSNLALEQEWKVKQNIFISDSKNLYDWAIKKGIAKEVARVVLPEGLTISKLYMKGSVRSWIHYLAVRLDPSTQKEHRLLAEEIKAVIEKVIYT